MATKSQLPTRLPSRLPTPLSVAVGATDLAVERVRGYVTDLSGLLAEAQKDLSGLQRDVQRTVSDPQGLRDQAVAFIEARVAELQQDAKAAPGKVQALVDDNVATLSGVLSGAYDDLAKRGDSLYGRIRRQESTQATVRAAETTVAKAKTTKTQASGTTKAATKSTAKKAAAKKSATQKKAATTRSSAKATATAAKKTAASAAQAVTDAAEKVGD